MKRDSDFNLTLIQVFLHVVPKPWYITYINKTLHFVNIKKVLSLKFTLRKQKDKPYILRKYEAFISSMSSKRNVSSVYKENPKLYKTNTQPNLKKLQAKFVIISTCEELEVTTPSRKTCKNWTGWKNQELFLNSKETRGHRENHCF